MRVDRQLLTIEALSAAATVPAALAANKVIRNTYSLLAMTLASGAPAAAATRAMRKTTQI